MLLEITHTTSYLEMYWFISALSNHWNGSEAGRDYIERSIHFIIVTTVALATYEVYTSWNRKLTASSAVRFLEFLFCSYWHLHFHQVLQLRHFVVPLP